MWGAVAYNAYKLARREVRRANHNNNTIVAQTHGSKERKVSKMATTNEQPTDVKKEYDGIFIQVPNRIAPGQESVRAYHYTDKQGKLHDMREVTLPRGVTVDGKDVGYHKFTVPASQMDIGNKYTQYHHSILVHPVNKDYPATDRRPEVKEGEFFPITLKKEVFVRDSKGDIQKDENGKYIVDHDESSYVTTSPQELSDALKTTEHEYNEQRKAQRAQEKEKAPETLQQKGEQAKAATDREAQTKGNAAVSKAQEASL
jgi:hypothetical protein